MTSVDLDAIRQAWATRRDAEAPERAYHGAALLVLKELAKGQPVTPARAAELVVGLTEAQAVVMFRRAAERGAELDKSGALIGNALTLKPTAHRLRVSGHQLYAWCSLDTLFLPSLLEQVAEVESECPVIGEPVSLVVGPEGVRSHSPDTMRASVVIASRATEEQPDSPSFALA